MSSGYRLWSGIWNFQFESACLGFRLWRVQDGLLLPGYDVGVCRRIEPNIYHCRVRFHTNWTTCAICSARYLLPLLCVTSLSEKLKQSGMIPSALGVPEKWTPTILQLRAMNDSLPAAKQYVVSGVGTVPASVHLGKIVKSIAGETVERTPGPAALLFSSLVEALSGNNMSRDNIIAWLLLIMEAMYCKHLQLKLVPHTSGVRLFRKVGEFAQVS